MQNQDGRDRKHPDQALLQVQHLRQEHHRGERRQQRHPQTAQRAVGAGKALQTLRHEEVPAERQSRDEEELSRSEEVGMSVHCHHCLR